MKIAAVKVAIVAESFLPRVNGVTNSVCRVLDHLATRGHEAMVIAPGPGPDVCAGFPVRLMPGRSVPFYPSFVVGLPSRRVEAELRDFRPDVVHLASPLVLGASGAAAARRLGIPAVAVFQTDVAGFARRYGLRGADRAIWSWLRHIHDQADRTLVPSTPVLRELQRRGLPRLSLWARGVDQRRFDPRHRSAGLRAKLAPAGEVLVGYVGRLAAEKRPRLLAGLTGIPGARLVVIGDGPEERRLRELLPEAVFTGFRGGRELSELIASLDVFVHTGADETFCQAVQEGLASGVPAVAPAAGGPLDLIRPGYNGLLFPPDDAAGFRAAVATLVRDQAARERMGVHARRSVRGRTWDAICDDLVRHYEDAVHGTSARSAA
ncbi:MAG: glycosyl transferase group 1 [Streptosporangiaceae bacterium]|nr:glycosyl transferase group 1 [Streptosporangiaceae bacterium]